MKVLGNTLDNNQLKIVKDNSKYLLVIAGAGSGKTLTIIGKIKYLIENKKIFPSEILCISFTNETCNNLKEKIKKELNINIDVYTFHKLALKILDNKYEITSTDTLSNIINEYFTKYIYKDINHLKIVLKYFNIKLIYDPIKQYNNLYKNNYKNIINLENLLITFIHLFKTNNYKINNFLSFKKQIKNNKEKYFLIITINILLLYENYLKETNEIDFDDMIIKATNELKDELNYKYIIIDEYQDTSFIRFLLMKKIIEKTNSKLLVVGDDYQSIYRFSGCDIGLFLNFKKYFKNSKVLKIENTYRNSQELVDIASSFIMKNKNQIPKKLVSNKHLSNPIKIIYYLNKKKAFKKLINSIKSDEILILSRNNNDIYKYIDNDFKLEKDKLIYLKDKNKAIKYLTIHKSKGLESDNVVIINMTNDILGLPSKIKNNEVLRFVSRKEDNYLYSEERRLFYVALTRTKNRVYILSPIFNKSIFIEEIRKILYNSYSKENRYGNIR